MAEGLPASLNNSSHSSDFSDDEEQSPLEIYFSKAADCVRKVTNKLNDEQLLELYALYKQGLEGPCNTPRPDGWFDVRGRKKWDAWKALGDMSQEEAKEAYIQLVKTYDPDTDLNCPTGMNVGWVAISSLRYSPEPELDQQNLTIFDAAREDLGDLVTRLLEQNPDLRNLEDDDGLTVLHWAADRDSTNALTAALQGGCNIDAVDDSGQTALHYAVSCSHVKSTKILLDFGAAMLRDAEGSTPLDLASDGEVRALLEGRK